MPLPRTPVNKPRILPLRAASDTASGYDGFIALLGKRERTRAMSTEENNKALVRRFYEAQTKGDLDTLRELLAPGILDHNLRPGQEPGREGFLRAVAEDHAAYSDLQYVIVEQMAAERQAHAEARRIIAGLVEHLPPQLEAPSEPRERPERGASEPERVGAGSDTGGASGARPSEGAQDTFPSAGFGPGCSGDERKGTVVVQEDMGTGLCGH